MNNIVKPVSVRVVVLVSLMADGPKSGLSRLYFGEARYAHRSKGGSKANTSFDRIRKIAVAQGFIKPYIGSGAYEITELGKELIKREESRGMIISEQHKMIQAEFEKNIA